MSKAGKELGSRGESAARAYLEEKGYHILEHNYRKRNGEIDLILRDGSTLVFCEVKTSRFRGAAERYSPRQQKRMKNLALSYISKKNWSGPVRFDLLTLEAANSSELYHLSHYKDILSFDELYL